LVDFGTGTGSYIVELLKSGLKFAMCTDFSQIMLNKCEAKLSAGGFDERFGVKKVCLPNSGTIRFFNCYDNFSGFENDEFEAAKCSMVIHHLVKTNENGVVDDWSPIGEAFSEAFRVLKPGGVFVVAFSTPEQRGGNW
jgi:ubiquinone/menaquinone biosynthesis C-methylase UbiE